MAHKPCFKQPINFVHAKDEYQSISTSTLCEKKSEHPQLDGHDIKSFYEELVGSSSSQDSAVKKSKRGDVSKPKPKTKSVHSVKHKHTSNDAQIRDGHPSNVIDAVGMQRSPVKCDSKIVKRESIGKQVSVSSKSVMRNENKFLHCAQEGDLKELRRLIEGGVDVNVHDAYGWTALMCASHTGHLPVIQYLVNSGARLTVRDSNGRTPIDIARLAKQHHLVKFYENMGQEPF